jgi:hypothetical protein
VIFSRGRRGSGKQARSGQQDVDAAVGHDGEAATEGALRGPYDAAEAAPEVQRLDLGSLRIPAVNGVEIRVQANPDGVIQQIVLVHGESALQLGVFAAPRSEGIWDEVRSEIRTSLSNEGATTEEVDGEYGVELRAQVRTPDGPTPLRFVGIDGPRWMVRGVYQGAAAVDPAAAGPLAECLDGLVVDRGREAKPVREPLPLQLPKEVAEQAGPAEDESSGAPVNGVVSGHQTPHRDKPSPRPRGSA